MNIDLGYGGIVMTDDCTFYDAYMLIIDESEKTIDVSDSNGMMIGMIHYDGNIQNVSLHKYNEKGRFTGDIIDIIKDGELCINENDL